MCFGLLIVLLVVTSSDAIVSGPLAPDGSDAVPRHVRPVDATAAARIAALLQDSMLVREMIAYLGNAEVVLTIRSSTSLMRDQRSGGLSRFIVANGVLRGSVEFDRAVRSADEQLITLAHELGHAVELAALPRRSTAQLGRQLLARIGRHDPWSSHIVIETAFAREVDERVAAELKYGPAPAGALHALSKRHRLALAAPAPGRRGTDADYRDGDREKKQ